MNLKIVQIRFPQRVAFGCHISCLAQSHNLVHIDQETGKRFSMIISNLPSEMSHTLVQSTGIQNNNHQLHLDHAHVLDAADKLSTGTMMTINPNTANKSFKRLFRLYGLKITIVRTVNDGLRNHDFDISQSTISTTAA